MWPSIARDQLIYALNSRKSASRASSRASSQPDEYATANITATSSSFGHDALHSTPQMINSATNTQQALPQQPQVHLDYDHFPDHVSQPASESIAELSIEAGRAKPSNIQYDDSTIISNPHIDFGDGSIYSLVMTPDFKSRNVSTKTNELRHVSQQQQQEQVHETNLRQQQTAGLRQTSQQQTTQSSRKQKQNAGLRREASVRHSSNIAPTKYRTLSEAFEQAAAEDDTSILEETVLHHTATLNTRNTRFTRTNHVTANSPASRLASAPLPQSTQRTNAHNRRTVPNAQSVRNTRAGYTNSFVLPELPNLTEIVAGAHKDGTPRSNHNTKQQSRFAPATNFRATTPHEPVESINVPEEEKHIYASLQLLKERVDQLEMEKSETAKRAEEYEHEITYLRSHLAVSQRRPDSALGISDEDADQWKAEKEKLQAEVQALQDQLARSNRKFDVAKNAVKRVTGERESISTQVEELKGVQRMLESDNQTLKKENAELRFLLEQSISVHMDDLEVSPPVQATPAPPAMPETEPENTTTHLEFPNPARIPQQAEDPNMTTLSLFTTEIGHNVALVRKEFEEQRIARRRASHPSPARAKNDNMPAPPLHTHDLTTDSRTGDLSLVSNASTTTRRRRKAASVDEGMTSAFILPDITLQHAAPTHVDVKHDAKTCTACPSTNQQSVPIPTPVPVSDRILDDDMDLTSVTIRPSQPPAHALAMVLKQLEDEIVHLKSQLADKQNLYTKYDSSLSRRRRVSLVASIEQLIAKVEKRSDQVYALYDVLEGQKQAAAAATAGGTTNTAEETVEETLLGLGIDPAELPL